MSWFRIDETVPVTGDKVLFSAAINDYPGSQNDLNGCLNDQRNVERTLLRYWPEFNIIKQSDSEVTRTNFKNQLKECVANFVNDPKIIIMDCCFAEDNTRDQTIKNRFIKPKKLPLKFNIGRRLFKSGDITWIAFSGSQDYQTSADAIINSVPQGAFTFYAMKALTPDITYRQWYEKTRDLLANSPFEQIPEIQGPNALVDQIVFSGRCLVVHYSGHGTYVPGGTEPDQQDEAMYVYDGMILDDELYSILSNLI